MSGASAQLPLGQLQLGSPRTNEPWREKKAPENGPLLDHNGADDTIMELDQVSCIYELGMVRRGS